MKNQNEGMVNVGPGNLGTAKIQRGGYLCALELHFTGTALDLSTHVEWVSVQLNQKEIVPKLTGAELERMNSEKGLFVDETALIIPFIDKDAINAGSMFVGGIDTAAGVSEFILQVKFAATAPGDIKVKILRDEVAPFRDPATGALIGLREFKAWSRSVVAAPAADLYTLEPETGREERLLRLFAIGANIEYVGLRKNGLPVHDDVPTALNGRALKDYGITQAAGGYLLDLVARGDLGEAVSYADARSISIRVKTTGAGNVPVIAEKLTRIDVL